MALNKFAPRSLGVIKPVGLAPKISAVKAPVKSKRTISDVLRAIPGPNNSGKLFNDEQIKVLSETVYPNGDFILNIDDNDITLHVIGWASQFGYDEVLKYIDAANDRGDLLWNNPTLAKAREADEKEKIILKEPEVGIKGIGRCGRCGSENIVFTETQANSGDEGFTYRFWCTECPHKWRMR